MLHTALVTSEQRGRQRTISSENLPLGPNTESTITHDAKDHDPRFLHPSQYEADRYREKTLRHMDSRSRSQLVESRTRRDLSCGHHTAFQNHSHRHSLPHIYRKTHLLRNIPMGELVLRPQIKRWTSYDPFKQPSEKANHECTASSLRLVSLNGRRSPRSRSRRSSNNHSSLRQANNASDDSERSAADGSDPDTAADPDVSIYLENQAIPIVQPNSKETLTLYSRVSDKFRVAHNSMASLITARDSTKPSPLCIHTPITRSELESDEGSDSANDDANEFLMRTPTLESPYQDEIDEIDPRIIDSLALEISGFQEIFVNRSRENQPNLKIGRTQQKLMDYKNLYETDQMTFADQQNSGRGSVASTYRFRIQSEVLTAQYTSIRLRFLERSIVLPRNPEKHRVKTTIGIYGFLDRYIEQKQPLSESTKMAIRTTASPSFEVGNYNHLLNRMWESTLT